MQGRYEAKKCTYYAYGVYTFYIKLTKIALRLNDPAHYALTNKNYCTTSPLLLCADSILYLSNFAVKHRSFRSVI